jgi:hypothetical protein
MHGPHKKLSGIGPDSPVCNWVWWGFIKKEDGELHGAKYNIYIYEGRFMELLVA